jgi:energy-coupling factor transport system permease protein
VGLSIPATNAAKDPKNVIMYLIPNINFFPITVEGIVYAISMGARFFEILIVILLIIMTTSVKDLVLPFMKYKRLVKFAIAASLSLTFIPALTRIVQQVLDAQKIRGWKGMESRNVVERIKSFIAIFIPVMVMSMDYATKIALALESRALDYDVAKRTLTRKLKYSKRDYAMFSFLVICILISLYLSEYVSGYGTYITTVRLIKKYFMQKAWP